MGELSPWHWLIVAVVFMVLFGSKKMPDAARSLGRSLRIFKSEISNLSSDAEPPATAPATHAAPQIPDGQGTVTVKVPSTSTPDLR